MNRIEAKLELVPNQALEVIVKEEAKKLVESSLVNQLWFVDTNMLVQLTCISKRSLEADILSHPYMRAIELRKNRKRYYPAAKALEAITEIMQQW